MRLYSKNNFITVRSDFTYGINVPVDDNKNETEASDKCEQRGLTFSRIIVEDAFSFFKPSYIYCKSNLQGLSV